MSEAARLYDSISGDAARRPALKQSLARVCEACDSLEKLQAPIEVSTVSEQIKNIHGKKAGPTPGSIRNQKETLLKYVYLRRGEQRLPDADVSADFEPDITDKKTADYVRLLKMRMKRLEGERNRAVHLLRTLDPIALETLLDPGKAGTFPAARPDQVATSLTNVAKHLLAAETLKQLTLELVLLKGQLVIRSKYQRWVLFWEDDVTTLANAAAVPLEELQKLARVDAGS